MQHSITKLTSPRGEVSSLVWAGDELIDYCAGGVRYGLDGSYHPSRVFYAFTFDAAVRSPSGRYAALYTRLGTKGLILDGLTVVREINRSYYHAHVYEYPICLFSLPDGREAIAHCPDEYNGLEIDDLATGQRLTARPASDAADFFHSRLAANPSGTWLISAGWVWHPFDALCVYDVARALREPESLDEPGTLPCRAEVSNAAFASERALVVATSREGIDDPQDNADDDRASLKLKPGMIGVYDMSTGQIRASAPLDELPGTLMPLDEHGEYVVGFHQHPKLVHVPTGQIVQRWEQIESGDQASSIIWHHKLPPPIAIDQARRRFAVARGAEITIVSF